MKIVFDRLAVKELEEAVEYYEIQVRGLGERFEKEIKRSLKTIKRFPEIGSIERGDIRKFLLHKFPYKILYSIEKNYLYVIAIAHLHREPTYWIKRRK